MLDLHKETAMFTASIGGYNSRTQPVFEPQPREWKREPEPEPEAQVKTDTRAGQRRAGAPSLTGQQRDPTWELQKEILGK